MPPLQPAHGGLLPHWHCPATQPSDMVESQLVHEPPPVPHAVIVGGVQVCPEQHPLGHEVASHTQLPPEQRCPDPQAGPPLHVHRPAVEHPSPLEPHAAHEPPAVPHVPDTCGWHWLFWQQPSGHDAALHVQDPPTHACPCGQAFPALQTQVPALVHVSALIPQGPHAPPPAPQAVDDGAVHVCPEQQPFGHVVWLQSAQEPALQMRPPQSSHMAPPAPQPCGSLPGSQLVPLQQPLHDWLSQMHLPPEQRWPVTQAGPIPHVQVPFTGEQPSPLSPHVWHD